MHEPDAPAPTGSRTMTESTDHLIGTLNEKSLHAALKAHYARPGDELEVPLDGYVIDIVRGDLLIEVQTGRFGSIKTKLRDLLPDHRIVLVYPIPQMKWIVKVAPGDAERPGERLSRRRSPKRGQPTDVFDELVRIPTLAPHPHLTLDVVMCHVDEIRCDDGEGSWRRKGVSILDQELLEVTETVRLRTRADFARFLPPDLPKPFTNRDLADGADITIHQARRMTYCLRKMGALDQVGKAGNAYLFARTE